MRNVAEALASLGSEIGLLKLALDSHGSCALTVNEKAEIFFHGDPRAEVMQISGVVGDLLSPNGLALARVLLELNFGAGQSSPPVFAADPVTSEVLLTRQLSIGGMTPKDLLLAVEDFVGGVEFWADRLPRFGKAGKEPEAWSVGKAILLG